MALSLCGCVGLEQYPTNAYTDANFWKYEENIRAALYLGYNQCWNAETYWSNNILSDDVYGSRHSSGSLSVVTGQATTSAGRFSDEWNQCYQELRTLHTALDNIDRMNMDEVTLKRFEAEWRLMRAFTYLRLVTWFGDVPFIKTNPTLEESKVIKRTSQSIIREFIHSELAEVAEILPLNTELSADENGRYTAGTAVALNARAYLYENDFENCEIWCQKLMDGEYGTYDLVEDYAQLFQSGEYSEESIMTIEFAHKGGTEEILRGWNTSALLPQSIGYPVGGVVSFSPTQELVDCYRKTDGSEAEDDDYDDRDERFYATIAYNGCKLELPSARGCLVKGEQGIIGRGTYTCWTKPDDAASALKKDPNLNDAYNASDDRTATGYYNIKNYNPSTINSSGISYKPLMEIRYADVLLMYAESMFEQGKMTPDVWDDTIGRLRQRAGFVGSYCAMPSEGLREAIRNERRVELALEGRRVFDLRRWAMLDNPGIETSGSTSLTSQATGAPFADNNTNIVCNNPYRMKFWFPIPQGERDINKNLTQNPGW